MILDKKAYCLIYRVRKKGVRVNTRNRTMFYVYGDTEAEARVKNLLCRRLCKEFGFVIQSEIA